MVQPLGNLFIIAAPSGAGKSSLINAYLKSSQQLRALNPAQLSVSHTTRAPREGEVDGEHYHFVDVSVFHDMIQDDAFYEHAQVFDNFYGTSKAAISDKLEKGIDVFLDIDWQGARQITAVNCDVTSIFILPPSLEELENRLIGRGKDSNDVIEHRMAQAMNEMSHAPEFDYTIINDDFEHALAHLAAIVASKSLQSDKQKLRESDLFSSLVR